MAKLLCPGQTWEKISQTRKSSIQVSQYQWRMSSVSYSSSSSSSSSACSFHPVCIFMLERNTKKNHSSKPLLTLLVEKNRLPMDTSIDKRSMKIPIFCVISMNHQARLQWMNIIHLSMLVQLLLTFPFRPLMKTISWSMIFINSSWQIQLQQRYPIRNPCQQWDQRLWMPSSRNRTRKMLMNRAKHVSLSGRLSSMCCLVHVLYLSVTLLACRLCCDRDIITDCHDLYSRLFELSKMNHIIIQFNDYGYLHGELTRQLSRLSLKIDALEQTSSEIPRDAELLEARYETLVPRLKQHSVRLLV